MTISIVSPSEYDEYTAYYLQLVPKGDFHEALENSRQQTVAFFQSIPKEKHEYRYAPGKWTIKDIVQHLIDVERIFAYRCLRFARKETVALPGFEVEDYAKMALANHRPMNHLIKEFDCTRTSTQLLFKSFTQEMWQQTGTASDNVLSVRAMGFKLIGHDLHHCQVIRERYL